MSELAGRSITLRPIHVGDEGFLYGVYLYRRLGCREVADKGVYLRMEGAPETRWLS